jgi:hypothetical protein
MGYYPDARIQRMMLVKYDMNLTIALFNDDIDNNHHRAFFDSLTIYNSTQ